MEIPALLDHLESDGTLLSAAAQRAGLDAPVPGVEWTVRELVTHVGGIHRWATDIVTACRDTHRTEAAEAVGTGPGDDELIEWFEAGHAALVETLRAATPELACFTFLPADSPRHFWSRRQAHETAIHRADAEAAGGPVTPFDPLFAQDGMAEILQGFALRWYTAEPSRATIGLDATDGPKWHVTFGERVEASVADDVSGAEATVHGTSSDLYRWLWNRPSEARVEGDQEIAKRWSAAVRVRWT
jgi:uncharacterized protein (TIGR03083 family)